jgi:ABC-type branched-subunit amino acid transport system ATPase component
MERAKQQPPHHPGLLRPREGKILFEGGSLTSLSTKAIVRLGISQSPEGRLIFPRMTVRENLEMGLFPAVTLLASSPIQNEF